MASDQPFATAAGEVRDGYDAWKALDAQERATAASEGERIDAACRAMVGAAAQPTAAARESVQPDCAVSGHLYDDDWPWPDQADMRALAPGSRVGDPCIWCDHDKGADE